MGEISDQEAAPPANLSSSSLDETVMLPTPTMGDDFKQFQELFKSVADSLDISLVEVAECQHKLLDILHISTSSKIALLINDAIIELAKTIW